MKFKAIIFSLFFVSMVFGDTIVYSSSVLNWREGDNFYYKEHWKSALDSIKVTLNSRISNSNIKAGANIALNKLDSTGQLKADSVKLTGVLKQDGVYGALHVHDTTTTQNIPTGTTYTKLTCFSDTGDYSNIIPDIPNDKITITRPGRYYVSGSFSFASGTNNVVFRIAAFLGNVEQDDVHFKRKIGTAGDVGNGGFVGFINAVTAPVDLDIRCRHDNAGTVAIRIEYANFTCMYVGQ